MSTSSRQVRLRTVFVSDVHLGSKGCRADQLLEFLKWVEVGDLRAPAPRASSSD